MPSTQQSQACVFSKHNCAKLVLKSRNRQVVLAHDQVFVLRTRSWSGLPKPILGICLAVKMNIS